MLHSPDSTPLSDIVHLDERSQSHVLHELQKLSIAGDSTSNVRLLFAEALQVVSSLSQATSSPLNPDRASSGDSDPSAPPEGKLKSHEDTTSSYLNAIMLFNAAFEAAQEANLPTEEEVDDYIFVRAVYTRLHRVQAAISLRVAEDIERDLRRFTKSHDPPVRSAHVNAIMTRAFDAVPPPNDDYWAQLEHVPAAASAATAALAKDKGKGLKVVE